MQGFSNRQFWHSGFSSCFSRTNTFYQISNPCLHLFYWSFFKQENNFHYSCGRRAISISWSDFPLVSTTFLFTKATAIKQKVPNIEYKSCGPSCSNSRKNSRPTKKFITWRRPYIQESKSSHPISLHCQSFQNFQI